MNHDFVDEDPKKPRVDSKGVACTGIGSIMDYAKGQEGNKKQWSTCCVEDMTAMIETYPNCLKVVDSKNPPPVELPQLPLTRNECDLNRIRPGLCGYSLLQLNGKLNYNFSLQKYQFKKIWLIKVSYITFFEQIQTEPCRRPKYGLLIK